MRAVVKQKFSNPRFFGYPIGMGLQVTTINVNGIRAAVKQRSEKNRGFIDWLQHSYADVVLMQEVRATDEDARTALQPLLETGWFYYGAPAAAKGRAGVAILAKTPVEQVHIGFGSFQDSGRYIEGKMTHPDFSTPVTVASLYLPSGSAGTAKQDEKYRFLDEFDEALSQKAEDNPLMVIGGDWNICHCRQDLKNWKNNQKKAGFLPDERAFMDRVFGTFPDEKTQVIGAGEFLGAVEYEPRQPRRQAPKQPTWFDVQRRLQPDSEGPYTWWSYRGQAFDNNAGWRIDYQAATAEMMARAERFWIDRAEAYNLRWSDHAPLNVVYQ